MVVLGHVGRDCSIWGGRGSVSKTGETRLAEWYPTGIIGLAASNGIHRKHGLCELWVPLPPSTPPKLGIGMAGLLAWEGGVPNTNKIYRQVAAAVPPPNYMTAGSL